MYMYVCVRIVLYCMRVYMYVRIVHVHVDVVSYSESVLVRIIPTSGITTPSGREGELKQLAPSFYYTIGRPRRCINNCPALSPSATLADQLSAIGQGGFGCV